LLYFRKKEIDVIINVTKILSRKWSYLEMGSKHLGGRFEVILLWLWNINFGSHKLKNSLKTSRDFPLFDSVIMWYGSETNIHFSFYLFPNRETVNFPSNHSGEGRKEGRKEAT
jgi:hypothetical protein